MALLMVTGTALAAPPKDPGERHGPPPAKVAVGPVAREAVTDRVTRVGAVEAFQSSTVASLTEGRVHKLIHRTGDRVPKGEPLVILETAQRRMERDRVAARVAAIRVRLAQAEADLALGEKLLREHAISADQVQTRQRTRNRTREELAEEAAELKRLEHLITQATIRAPFGGTVAQELTQAGEWVPEGGGVARLVDLAIVRIRVWVPEREVVRLSVGAQVTAVTPAGTVTGTIHAVIPDGDPKGHTFPVEIRVKNDDGHLFQGMVARVTLPLGTPHEALTVPADALVTRASGTHLWKLVDGHAVRVIVTPGGAAGDAGTRVAITPRGDLKPGDLVVTRGNERVRDGQSVQIMPPAP